MKSFLMGCGIGSWIFAGLIVIGANRSPVGQPVPAIMDANDIYAYQWRPHKPEDCPGLQIKYRMEPGEYTCAVCGRKFDYGAKLNAPYDPNDPNLLLAIEQYHALAEKIADEYIKHLKEDVKRAEQYIPRYDPNDPVYKFIAPAPKDWTNKFGDNERTRLLHSISELRVVVAAQGKRQLALEDGLKDIDWDLLPRKTKTIESAPVIGKDPNEAKR